MKISDKETLSIATTVSDVLEGKSKVQKMDPKKHVSKDKESGAFCVYNSAGKKVKEFESNEEAEKYAIDNHDDLMKEVAEPEAKGEKDFKAKHKIKKSGEKEDGTVVKEVLGVVKEEDKLDEAGMANEGKKFDKAYDAWHKSTVQLTRALEKDAGNKSGVSKFKKALQDIENAIDASDLEESVEEAKSKFSKALLKKATDTALKMSGNMTGAVKEIEKMKKGLSKDKEVAAALQLANEEVSEAILVAAHEINETKTKVQEDKKRYQKFFNSALKKFGVNSPAELKGDKKKEFFDYVDKNYEADNETD